MADATFYEAQCYQPKIAEALPFRWSIQIARQLTLPRADQF